MYRTAVRTTVPRRARKTRRFMKKFAVPDTSRAPTTAASRLPVIAKMTMTPSQSIPKLASDAPMNRSSGA